MIINRRCLLAFRMLLEMYIKYCFLLKHSEEKKGLYKYYLLHVPPVQTLSINSVWS